jgi:hypothetical protein
MLTREEGYGVGGATLSAASSPHFDLPSAVSLLEKPGRNWREGERSDGCGISRARWQEHAQKRGRHSEIQSRLLPSRIRPRMLVASVREDCTEDASGIYGRSILYMVAQASNICEHKHLSILFFLSFLPRNLRV